MSLHNYWDDRFIDLADHISSWSKDTIKVGCIIVDENKRVLATGYNGMPSWFDDAKLFDLGDQKNTLITHAEINALNCLSVNDDKDKSLSLYVNRPPCFSCSSLIINSLFNIERIFYVDRTNKEHQESLNLFNKNNIKHYCLSDQNKESYE